MARGRPSRQSVYDRLEEALEDLRTRMGGLPRPAEAEGIWAELWHQEAHHSTALEGNTVLGGQPPDQGPVSVVDTPIVEEYSLFERRYCSISCAVDNR